MSDAASPRALAAEFIGTALLLAAVIGSGVMAETLSQGNVAIALLANTVATAGALYALIAGFGPISGAHFNPVVSACLAWRGDLPWRAVPGYALAQLAGGVAGAMLAHAMFSLPLLSVSAKARPGGALMASEVVATFGLIGVIWLTSRRAPATVPAAVAGWIAAAYWFTASTSFANPAAVLGRSLSDTFAGVRPMDGLGFVAAEIAGGVLAVAFFGWLEREPRK